MLHFIPPAPVAKCLQQLDEGGITTPPKSENQTGVADLYAVYTITIRRYKNQIVVFLCKQTVQEVGLWISFDYWLLVRQIGVKLLI